MLKNKMTHLSHCISSRSWIFIYLFVIPLFATLGPSLSEIVVMLVVDLLAFFINQRIEHKIFQGLFPDTKMYFNGIDIPKIKSLPFQKQLDLYHSFLLFPKRRAFYCAIGSYIKVIPAILIMVFYWEHDISNWQQFWLVMCVISLNFTYFYGAVFIESHIFLSDLINKIHMQNNWENVFKSAEVSRFSSDFELNEGLILASIVLFMLALQMTIIESGKFSGSTLSIMIVLSGTVAFILFAHVWHLSRQFFSSGLKNLFQAMDDIDYKKAEVIPLHSTALLARFEKSFNLLVERLKASEQEIATWVFNEVEKSRYHALGEMSALIAHDMTSSLHVINFCIDTLKENPDKIKDPAYLTQLSTNMSRVLDLIDSLRARLKNAATEHTQTSFKEAHNHVLRILSTQYKANEFNLIAFEIDSNVENIVPNMSRMDFIHILENLYRNSIQNLIENNIVNPRISVKIKENTDTEIHLLIIDNGTGLGIDQFEALTAFSFTKQNSGRLTGLGLKLIRRLAEINGGSLAVIPNPINENGTSIVLKLKAHLSHSKEIRKAQVELSV